MDKRYLRNIMQNKRTLLSAVMCMLALGVVSGVTNYRNEVGNSVTLERERQTEQYAQSEAYEPVISTKNAGTKEKREEVLTVVEEYTDEEYEAAAAINNEFVLEWPVAGEIVMDFSNDALIYDVTLEQYRTNDSVSISADLGDDVCAASSGVIKKVAQSREDGWYVVIDHENGWETTYGQLGEDVTVSEGERIGTGDILGFVAEPSIYGSMLGEHVDFKVTLNDNAIDPKTAVGENIGE